MGASTSVIYLQWPETAQFPIHSSRNEMYIGSKSLKTPLDDNDRISFPSVSKLKEFRVSPSFVSRFFVADVMAKT